MMWLCAMLLTTFISVDGQLLEVPINSVEARNYYEESVTDIGDTSNYLSEEDFSVYPVSSGDAADGSAGTVNTDYSDMVMLLEEQVELLSENSSTVTGALNSSVLELMDRIIDDYPSYYKYAGFRTSDDDTYTSTLYISKKATTNNNVITFSDDCKAIHFYRTTNSSYSNYLYYTVSDSPGATVSVNNLSIVYTNVLDGYPALGNKSVMPDEYLWIVIFAFLVLVIFMRRIKHD